MNGIARSVLRLPSLKSLVKSGRLSGVSAQTRRSLWGQVQQQPPKVLVAGTRDHQRPCACLSCRFAHTKAEKELVEFLAEEIVAEKKAQKLKTIPTEIKDFKVALNGAEVTLTKATSTERITISFNINHTVDSDAGSDVEANDDKGEVAEIKSKPNFEIDIKRGGQTLSFGCSFNNEPGASGMDDTYSDVFGIDEITLYEGEHEETVYSVAGEIIDGYLYDLLMNYLEEKGISNEFADQMVELSTNYEHTAYIGLLEGLSKFTTK